MIADDFDAIRARLREMAEEQHPIVTTVEPGRVLLVQPDEAPTWHTYPIPIVDVSWPAEGFGG